MGKIIKTIALAVGTVTMSVMGLVWFYSATLPDSYYVGEDPLSVSTLFSISAKPCKDVSFYASTYGNSKSDTFLNNGLSSVTKVSDSTLMLFNSVPIKNVQEKTVSRPVLVPGGQPFGIKLMTDGVVVVKMEKIDGVCPAADCGIRVGDIITSVNGESVDSNQKISQVISDSKGKPCIVNYKRNDEEKTATLSPVYTQGSYKAGIWVRDSSAGVGTVTFYDPETEAFGGLGHPICDCDTKQTLPLSEGTVGDVKITGCNKSKDGSPGQLVGEFTSNAKIGTILSNSECGIFGTLYSRPTDNKAIPMGFRQEIHTGEATIYTTIDGKTPKEYTIEIEKVNMQEDAEHDMIIRVTDKELLDKTGGIVQGMSGSPIIQDGKLVGAITHVFVDNPDEGYGVFADSMYEQACKCAEKQLDLAG
ncbi:MAG: SpoIVB peptidase [Oscillospiraceae bacterium]